MFVKLSSYVNIILAGGGWGAAPGGYGQVNTALRH